MKSTFDHLSEQYSRLTTRKYSTSFSLGILLFRKNLRKHIYNIYGFVRMADEIVDSFHNYDKSKLLCEFRRDTFDAIEQGISLNPILNAFQNTVNKFQIDQQLINSFLDSMASDLEHSKMDRESFEKYILGSAEVVGLMCLSVFVEGDKSKYEQLTPSAMKLGAAFQKVNFMRDIRADYLHLGRSYFPGIDLDKFEDYEKSIIEAEIEKDFEEALRGIRMLPDSSRGGVYLAFIYYRHLLRKIRKTSAKAIMEKRIRVPNSWKFGLMISSLFKLRLNII